MELRIPLFATYILLLITSEISWAQVTYQDAFPNLSFEYPTEIMNAGDGTNRLFVLEQAGRIKVFQNNEDATSAGTFLDITDTVSFSSGQEIGLLGLAFHPDYANNGLFYVYHTRQSSVSGVNVEIVLARYSVRADNPNLADTSSRLDVLSFDKNQVQSNHNGGKIAFGPDGYLYVSIGDGGGGGDPSQNAQNLDNVFGSILRIDVDMDGNNPVEDNPDLPNGNYEIPSDNPRVGQSGLDELYAWGIRNTWKFSFDAPTGNMWGADVGQDDREEINLIVRGANYGWNRFEGNTTEDGSTVLATTPDIKPIFEYGRSNGDVSITGGYVYRGISNNPQIKDKYIFGDYITGRVWALDYDPSSGNATSELLFRTNGQYISSFGLDGNGEMFFSDYGTSSKLYKIIGGNNGPQTVAVNGIGDWYAMAEGTNGTVGAMAANGDDSIIIGGGFSTAGGLAPSNIALYDQGTGWNDFSNGANGDIKSIAIDSGGNVFAGGDFSQIAGIQANNIAVWNGSWSALGQGTNGPVSSIGIGSDNKVYVGGTFEMAGGIAVNNIALWSDGAWMPLSDSTTGTPGTNNEVRAISIDENGQVYIGGNFDTAGGRPAPRIAVWDGTDWGTLGTGTSGFVQAIATTPNYIYAGGNFAIAGNATVNRIARWDRASMQWEALGYGLSGNVNALEFDGDYLYAGGNFETASDQQDINKIMNNIARWSDNKGWEALGNGTQVGVDNIVNSLTFDGTKTRLYVGGTFNVAGKDSASNITYWDSNLDCIQSIIPEYTINGTTDSGLNAITVTEGTEIILSMLPKEIEFTIELVDGSIVSGDHTINNLNESHEGTYIFESNEGCIQNFQIIMESVIQDSDNDGVPDDTDQCPDTAPEEVVDNVGCPVTELPLDSDNDGVPDDTDQCPNTAPEEVVDNVGCPVTELPLDSDNDGVPDDTDQCPDTAPEEVVDNVGCPVTELPLDSDNDGVPDDTDQCPDTAPEEVVDNVGCPVTELPLDSDNDGVPDDTDQCPDTAPEEAVDNVGCPVTELPLDSDNDGVPDDTDQCPNTAPEEEVDIVGCTVLVLPVDNYIISASGLSCSGAHNGAITISAINTNFESTATLLGEETNKSYNFTGELKISDLNSGSYRICITNKGYPNYNNCSKIVITTPEELIVLSSLDTKSNILTLKMSGGKKYNIIHNEMKIITSDSSVDLILDQDVNTIQVSTDVSCQGSHTEFISLKKSVIHPNPFKQYVILSHLYQSDGNVEVSIYTTAGELVIFNSYLYHNGMVQIEIPNLPTGTYYLLANDGVHIDNHKIVKH